MKIPESNHGAYYGNEDNNGQWQGNGVTVDSGVGGGVVGSGDAGFQQDMYPGQRHPHDTGYVMGGVYYTQGGFPAAPPDDFADYMWMENEEEFDKQVMQQLEEEALMEQCIEAMLEDERRERNSSQDPSTVVQLAAAVSRSTLNPLAAEFVPSFTPRSTTGDAQNKEKPPEPTPATSNADKPFEDADSAAKVKCEDTAPSNEVPNSTATSVPPKEATESKSLEKSPTDGARVKKTDSKAKSKTVISKSDSKLSSQIKSDIVKKDVKSSKSEEIMATVTAPNDHKSEVTTPVEEVATSGFKPINYAAAAKANKPKKATTPPVSEKPSLTTVQPKAEKPVTKTARPTDKLRKNSTK